MLLTYNLQVHMSRYIMGSHWSLEEAAAKLHATVWEVTHPVQRLSKLSVYFCVHMPQRIVNMLLHGSWEIGEDCAEASCAVSAPCERCCTEPPGQYKDLRCHFILKVDLGLLFELFVNHLVDSVTDVYQMDAGGGGVHAASVEGVGRLDIYVRQACHGSSGGRGSGRGGEEEGSENFTVTGWVWSGSGTLVGQSSALRGGRLLLGASRRACSSCE
jgi:hypothetical protein